MKPFVTIEGIDGAGKSTVVEAIQDEFDRVATTSEPTENEIGKLLRKSFQEEDNDPIADFMLFMADHQEHIENFIKPNLRRDWMVVSDRYADSTRAYQALLLDDQIVAPETYIQRVMEPWNLEPDLTIYLDVPAAVGMQRADSGEKYEKRQFLSKVRANYNRIGNRFSKRWNVVDATQPEEEVVDEVISIIEGRV